MPYQPDAIDVAERLGRMEAQSFDQALRDRERRELQERWSRIFPRPEASESAAAAPGSLDLQTRHTLERMIDFHNAVVSSRTWKLLQALRRPFGRAW